MRIGKKMVVAIVLVAVMVAGTIGGVVYAGESDSETQAESRLSSLQARVSELYQEKTGTDLDWDALKESLAQAGEEARIDALANRLQNAVDEGKITQEEADEYLEWQQARPDVPIGPRVGGMGKMHGFGCKMMMRGFGGPGAPPTE